MLNQTFAAWQRLEYSVETVRQAGHPFRHTMEKHRKGEHNLVWIFSPDFLFT